MFSLGIFEIALVAIVVVVLFPPTELPKLARSLARVYGSVRRVADDFRATVLEDDDIGKPIREIRTAYQETRWQLRKAEEAARRDLARARTQVKAVAETGQSPSSPAGTVASGDTAGGSEDATGSSVDDSVSGSANSSDTTASEAPPAVVSANESATAPSPSPHASPATSSSSPGPADAAPSSSSQSRTGAA